MADGGLLANSLIRLAILAVVIYAALVLFVYLVQERMLYLPGVPSRELVATPEQIGLRYEEVELETSDGETLHGWYVPAEDPRGVVLIFHGNAGNISHRLETLRIWNGLRLDALIIDYRGYGRSSGRPSEEGLHRDAQAAWRHLLEERGADPRRVVLFGRSLGGAVAARLAAQVRPAGVVVESTFTSVPDIAAELYPWLPVRWLARLDYPAREAIAEADAPVLVVHSRDDEIIPFHHGQALYGAAGEPKGLLEIRGDHNTGFLTSGERYIGGLARFLDEIL